MRCDDARRAVSALLDGEPAPDGLDRHVDTCADCARFRAVAVDVRSRLDPRADDAIEAWPGQSLRRGEYAPGAPVVRHAQRCRGRDQEACSR